MQSELLFDGRPRLFAGDVLNMRRHLPLLVQHCAAICERMPPGRLVPAGASVTSSSPGRRQKTTVLLFLPPWRMATPASGIDDAPPAGGEDGEGDDGDGEDGGKDGGGDGVV